MGQARLDYMKDSAWKLAELMSRRNGGEYHRFGKKEIKKNKS